MWEGFVSAALGCAIIWGIYKNSVDELKAKVTVLEPKVSKTENTLATGESEHHALADRVSRIENKCDKIEEQVSDTSKRVGEAEKANEVLRAEMRAMVQILGRIEAKQDRDAQVLDTFRTEMRAAVQRVDDDVKRRST